MTEANEPDDIYATLKARLLNTHDIRIQRRTIEEMTQALRVYDDENRIIREMLNDIASQRRE